MPFPSSRYRIVTIWRVEASLEEVGAVLADIGGLSTWWPSVYLSAEEIAPGDALGVGKVVALHTKGWLPYTLRWRFRVTEVDPPRRVVLVPEGDFTGRGTWTFAQEGAVAVIRYDWDVEARKPVLRALTWLLRPLFTANHLWAMRQGEESLRLEVRRRAATETERARLPPPPGPSRLTFSRSARAPAIQGTDAA
ncbi:SRPBCC family protein [Rubellimicrobium roseum]|uniref:Polyketide cyclase n=1 Tax=Rubellimicrobium roseum TaxID=687525 RepID=A0A5C4N9M4_9RHOB|nr:SRPBCC family protein [Rubellimicrobium roseum]TNC66829.1 polyketide cyclase [Rubellimicrobium roseum]